MVKSVIIVDNCICSAVKVFGGILAIASSDPPTMHILNRILQYDSMIIIPYRAWQIWTLPFQNGQRCIA